MSCIPALKPIAPIIRAYYERWDGKGYEHGLAREAIPYAARLLAVVDSYVVITNGRVYQKRRSQEEALAELQRVRARNLIQI